MKDNLQTLISKLNPTCKQSLEDAVALCVAKTHYDTEIQHWFLSLLSHKQADLILLLQHYQIDISQLKKDILAYLDALKTGNNQTPTLSVWLVELAREAWLLASLHQETTVRSLYWLMALIQNTKLCQVAYGISAELKKIPSEFLDQELSQALSQSCEAVEANPKQALNRREENFKATALAQFTVDLTELALNGGLDPVIGRDTEIRQMIDILQRRRQNNPILTGEPGVGKTAVVEGLALQIAEKKVPEALQEVKIHTLDLGLLLAGAGVKGEFENRLKQLIQDVKRSPQPIILFIDEAHTLIGAGGAQGQGDAANLLKPALARGELRTIAATTWGEYKKYFEQDSALTRRFQVIKVEEPSIDVAIQMCQSLAVVLAKHHKLTINNNAIEQAVKLSERYLSERKLPDKAISVLDTACARVAMQQWQEKKTRSSCRRQSHSRCYFRLDGYTDRAHAR